MRLKCCKPCSWHSEDFFSKGKGKSPLNLSWGLQAQCSFQASIDPLLIAELYPFDICTLHVMLQQQFPVRKIFVNRSWWLGAMVSWCSVYWNSLINNSVPKISVCNSIPFDNHSVKYLKKQHLLVYFKARKKCESCSWCKSRPSV